jgi:hypothetical protein
MLDLTMGQTEPSEEADGKGTKAHQFNYLNRFRVRPASVGSPSILQRRKRVDVVARTTIAADRSCIPCS